MAYNSNGWHFITLIFGWNLHKIDYEFLIHIMKVESSFRRLIAMDSRLMISLGKFILSETTRVKGNCVSVLSVCCTTDWIMLSSCQLDHQSSIYLQTLTLPLPPLSTINDSSVSCCIECLIITEGLER